MGSRLKTARRTIFSTPFQALRAKEMPSTSADPPVRTRLRGPRLESCYRQSNFRRTGYARPLDAAGGPLLVFFCSGTAFFRRCLRQRAHRAFRASGDHDFGITCFLPYSPAWGSPSGVCVFLFRNTRPLANLIRAESKRDIPCVAWDISFGSPCWARTNDPAVNSRMLYQLS